MIELYEILIQTLEDEGVSQKKRRDIHHHLLSFISSTGDLEATYQAYKGLRGMDTAYDKGFGDVFGPMG